MRKKRQQGQPLQYIIGHTDFMGHKIFVNPNVLIPRAETEIMVDEIIRSVGSPRTRETNQPVHILELGTGSGNIAISLAKAIINSRIISVDVSKPALTLARRNIKHHLLEDQVQLVHDDMSAFLTRCQNEKKTFDVIVSNPPYIPSVDLARLPIDVQKEPKIALDGGTDGLKYIRWIVMAARSLLNERGFLFLELFDGQDDPVKTLIQSFPELTNAAFIKDYTGINRIVYAQRENLIWKNS
jgi:release factor glutamine methyltransferase